MLRPKEEQSSLAGALVEGVAPVDAGLRVGFIARTRGGYSSVVHRSVACAALKACEETYVYPRIYVNEGIPESFRDHIPMQSVCNTCRLY